MPSIELLFDLIYRRPEIVILFDLMKRINDITVLSLSLLLYLGGCEEAGGLNSSGGSGDDDDNADGGGTSDDDDDSGGGGNDTDSDTRVCDEQNIIIKRSPVRLMILQDLSSSMKDSRWQQAKAALIKMLETFKGQNIQFGFNIFPSGSAFMAYCEVNAPLMMDCAPNNEDALIALLNGIADDDPSGLTPLWLGMNNFTNPSFAPVFMTADTIPKYLLVVSDGEDDCGTSGTIGGIVSTSQLSQLTSGLSGFGIKTFVIGFGMGAGSNQLNAIASAGGTPFNTFLDAQDQQGLEDALYTIASTVASCDYEVDSPDASADPNQVNFYFDDEIVYFDENCAKGVGWTWADSSHKKILLCAQACQQLNTGVRKISAKFGCPSIPVPVL